MKIKNDEEEYWTEIKGSFRDSEGNTRNKLGFWSAAKPFSQDKRNFFIIKALFLYALMKMGGLKVTLVSEQ